VVQVTDLAGKVTFEALDTKALDARTKALDEAYAKAVKEESDPKPTKPVVTVLKSGIADKAAAEAEATRLKEEYEKKLKEKEAAK
jgi:hypothetical protein